MKVVGGVVGDIGGQAPRPGTSLEPDRRTAEAGVPILSPGKKPPMSTCSARGHLEVVITIAGHEMLLGAKNRDQTRSHGEFAGGRGRQVAGESLDTLRPSHKALRCRPRLDPGARTAPYLLNQGIKSLPSGSQGPVQPSLAGSGPCRCRSQERCSGCNDSASGGICYQQSQLQGRRGNVPD